MRVNGGLAVLGLVLSAGSSWGATVVAGPATCSAAMSHPYYATIQQAVNSVPAGSVVLVCPGTYAEQVSIDKSLTLKGVVDTVTDNDAAVIAVPPGGLTTTPDLLPGRDPVAAQVLVSNGATVAISNLTVDGSANTIASCGIDLVGIAFLNASGSVTRAAVVNQLLAPNYRGCQAGQGIYIETDGVGGTANVTVSDSHVANFNKNGITARSAGTSALIDGNTVFGIGPTPDIAQNGIQVSFGATGTVTGNVVGDAVYTGPSYGSSGILVYASPNVAVTNNTVSNTQYAVAVVGEGNGDADHAIVTGNHLQATRDWDAIDLCGSSFHTVSKNVIQGTGEAGIHVACAAASYTVSARTRSPAHRGVASVGNSVTKNTINAACAGLLVGPGADAGAVKNTFFNVGTRVLSDDICPSGAQAARQSQAAKKRSGVKPLR